MTACLDCGRGPLIPAHQWREGRQNGGAQAGGRGLCRTHYEHRRRAGTLHECPRHNRPIHDRADLIREWTRLRDEGLTTTQIAARMGIGRTTIYGALGRDSRHAGRIGRAATLTVDELARLRRMVGVA